MRFSKVRLFERSARNGRKVEKSPIAFSSSENFRPSNNTPTTGFELPVRRAISICQQASRNVDVVLDDISNGSVAGWKAPVCFLNENLTDPTSDRSWSFQNH